MFYGVFTEDGLDQVCSTSEEAKREKRDLREMGCSVNVMEAADEREFDAVDYWMREGWSFPVAARRAKTARID